MFVALSWLLVVSLGVTTSDEAAFEEAAPEEAAPEEAASEEAASEEAAPASEEAPPEEAGPRAGPPLRVVVPEFTARTDDVSDDDLGTMTGLVVYQLGKVERFDVISGADIRDMLQLEAERAAVGCTDASCMAEIADALGAELLLSGQVGRLGPRWIMQLSLIYTPEARVVGRTQVSVTQLSELPPAVRRAVHDLTLEYGGVPNIVQEEAEEAEARTSYARRFASLVTAPDTVMLIAVFAGGLLGMAGPLGLLAPVVQAATLFFFGDDLAGREYPWWWLAIPAGLVTYGAAVMLTGAMTGGGALASVLGGNYAVAGGVGATAGASAGALMVFLVEPVVAWWAGTLFARDVELFHDVDDERPEAPAPPVAVGEGAE